MHRDLPNQCFRPGAYPLNHSPSPTEKTRLRQRPEYPILSGYSVIRDGTMAKKRANYPNPPIQETICEVHFDLGEPLALQRIELLKDVWAAGYPEQKIVQEKSVNFYLSPQGIQTNDEPWKVEDRGEKPAIAA
jgi:hypothetical protein